MNPEPTQETPDTMHKEETVKDDGRQLIYYTFSSDDSSDETAADAPASEEAPSHV